MNETATEKQTIIMKAVNDVVRDGGDPWCSVGEISTICGLHSRVVSSVLRVMIDKGWIEKYGKGYRPSIWL